MHARCTCITIIQGNVLIILIIWANVHLTAVVSCYYGADNSQLLTPFNFPHLHIAWIIISWYGTSYYHIMKLIYVITFALEIFFNFIMTTNSSF